MVIKNLIKAKNLDIFDLNYDLSSKKINQVERLGKGKFDILEGVLRFIYFTIISIAKLNFNIGGIKSKSCFIVGSKNQENAGIPLKAKMESAEYLTHGSFTRGFYHNSEAISYLLSLLFLPVLIITYFKTDDVFLRKMLRCRLDRYLHSYGLFLVYSFILERSKKNLEFVIFSNDHTVWNRTFLKAMSNYTSLKSAYIQHANVSSTFPPLSFNYAFLDGKYAKDTYTKIGKTKTEIYCVGCLRMEKLRGDLQKESCLKDEDKHILCCFNKADTDSFILDTLHKIGSQTGLSKIGFRMHPADPRVSLQRKLVSLGFIDESETSFDLLANNYSYCFAGNSGVFLDAYSTGLQCFSVRSWFGNRDYYKFEENSLVFVFDSFDVIDQSFYITNVNNKSNNNYYFSVDEGLEFIKEPSSRILSILKY